MRRQKQMEITLEPYDNACHDGCCGTWGWDIFVDGQRIGDIEGDDVEWLVERLNLHFMKIKNIEWREPLKY